MKTDNILKQHELCNGLKAVVSDLTRHYFGGYFHVRMFITADVVLVPDHFDSMREYEDAVRHLGPVVQFSRMLEKMAVPEAEQQAVRQGLMESFQENLLPYMERPDFSRRFVISEYNKALKNTAKAGSRRRHE